VQEPCLVDFDRVARVIRSSIACWGDLPFSRMAYICSVIGISTFFLWARPAAALVVNTPRQRHVHAGDNVGKFAAFAQLNPHAAVAREISGAG